MPEHDKDAPTVHCARFSGGGPLDGSQMLTGVPLAMLTCTTEVLTNERVVDGVKCADVRQGSLYVYETAGIHAGEQIRIKKNGVYIDAPAELREMVLTKTTRCHG